MIGKKVKICFISDGRAAVADGKIIADYVENGNTRYVVKTIENCIVTCVGFDDYCVEILQIDGVDVLKRVPKQGQ